jgi:hypothetical protein
MKAGAKTISAICALIGPTILTALSVELRYAFEWQTQWLEAFIFVASVIASLTTLGVILNRSWSFKLLLAVPFLAFHSVRLFFFA